MLMVQIMENMGFVHEVKSLILQLGCIPNALLSEDYSTKFSNERLDGRATSGVPVSVDSSVITSNSTPSVVNGSNHRNYSSHSLCPLTGKNNNRQERVVVAEVIPSNFDSSLQQHSVSYNAGSEFNKLAGSAPFGQSGPSDYVNPRIHVSSSVNISQLKTDRSHNTSHNVSSSSTSSLRGIPVHGGMNNLLRTPECSDQKILPEVSNFSSTDQKIDYNILQTPNIPSFIVEEHVPNSCNISGFVRDCIQKDGTGRSAMNPKHKEACAQHSSGGDDLFDILGVDFKNELLKGHWNELFADEPDYNAENMVKKETCLNIEGSNSDYYSVNKSMSESGIFSGISADNLLDAVVSKAKPTLKQNSDDLSCRTTLTGNSTASIPSPLHRKFTSSNFQGGLFDISKNGDKTAALETSSLRSGFSKDDVGNCSQTTTLCGSQLSSWLENGGNLKGENSVSTGYSKRPNEACKSNRKRLKPGENPRPRPKDRQMIQDRVKELREIVPNGAKVISSFIS